MPRELESSAKRPRISIDVRPELRRRLRMAAARRDVTVREYVLDAIEERLKGDVRKRTEQPPPLDGRHDPVLAELWDNERDATYDRL